MTKRYERAHRERETPHVFSALSESKRKVFFFFLCACFRVWLLVLTISCTSRTCSFARLSTDQSCRFSSICCRCCRLSLLWINFTPACLTTTRTDVSSNGNDRRKDELPEQRLTMHCQRKVAGTLRVRNPKLNFSWFAVNWKTQNKWINKSRCKRQKYYFVELWLCDTENQSELIIITRA